MWSAAAAAAAAAAATEDSLGNVIAADGSLFGQALKQLLNSGWAEGRIAVFNSAPSPGYLYRKDWAMKLKEESYIGH